MKSATLCLQLGEHKIIFLKFYEILGSFVKEKKSNEF